MQVRYVIGIVILIAAVPLQFYLMKYNQDFKSLVMEITKKLPDPLQGVSVDLTDYVNTANEYMRNVYDFFDSSNSSENENSSEEDFEPPPEETIRNFRPPHLEFRIGDVILTRNAIIGAIVGWDIDMTDLTKEPEYHILGDRLEQLVKETQNNMIQLDGIKVNNKVINHYFEKHDGLKYIPKKWMQKLYPKD